MRRAVQGGVATLGDGWWEGCSGCLVSLEAQGRGVFAHTVGSFLCAGGSAVPSINLRS